MKKIYLVLALLITGSFVFAQSPLFVEDFNYPAGDLLTAHGWTAHSGGTTAAVAVTSPGLTFDGYVGSNKGLAAGVLATGQDVNAQFTEQTTGSVYTSFMVNAAINTGFGGYFFHYFDPNASTAFRARTFIKPLTGKMKIGFSFNASSPQDSSLSKLLNFGETYLFVVKYTMIAGPDNDNVSLYVFKAGDNFTTEPATPFLGPLTATRTTPSDPNSALGPDIRIMGIALRQFESVQGITVDGFRVKNKWELTQDVNVGIEPGTSSQIRVYPNPVSDGYLNVTTPGSSEKKIEIYTVVGKSVFNQKTSASRIDINTLKPGVYVLKVTADNRTTSSKLIIK
jgi:hypothetical protein